MQMSALTRRGFLGAGAGGTVAALTTVGPAYAGTPDTAGETGRAVGAPPAVTVTSDDFRYGDLTARGYNGRFVGKPDSVRIVHTTEQVTAAVAFGGRRTGYGIGPDHAVVLAVPRFAARHAADHIRDDRQRITLGPELAAGGAGPDEQDVPALLRGACPYLPADAERDGPGVKPMAMVTTARAVRRAARLGWRAAYSGPDSMEVYNDLVVGKYSWVPDDEHPGPAASEMEHLPVH